MKNQEYYEQLFEPYPDVVTLDEFRAMLGGIGETTARKILHGNHIYLARRTPAFAISAIAWWTVKSTSVKTAG